MGDVSVVKKDFKLLFVRIKEVSIVPFTNIPFEWNEMRPAVRHLVQETEELFKRIEERPVRQDANGFESVDCVVLACRRLINVIHVEPITLTFRHLLFGIALVESYRRTVNLSIRKANTRHSSTLVCDTRLKLVAIHGHILSLKRQKR